MIVPTAGQDAVRAGDAARRSPVAIQLWILAGTAAERRHEHGCAHLLEHMLFKPTSAAGERGPGDYDIASAIEALAGDVNAFTSHDETVFHATVPSAAVDAALRALVGAVARPRLDPEELRREAKVVVQEIRQADDDPAGRVGQELLELLYRGHAYGRPVLGRKREVLGHDVRRLLAAHRDLYTADRCILVVAGPVNPRAVIRSAEALLGALPRRGRGDTLSEPRPPTSPRIRVRSGAVHEAHIALGWSAPPVLRPGTAIEDAEAACAIEVASVVLGYGEASRLAERVRRRAGLVTDAYASFYASRMSSALMISLHTTGARSADAADAVLQEIETLRHVPIDPDELRRAQAVIRSEVVYRQETAQGLAHALGYQLSLSGEIAGEEKYFALVDALTPATVQQACARFLAPARTVVAAVVPKHRAHHERVLRSRVSLRLRPARRRRGPKIQRGRDGIVRVDFDAGLRLRARVDPSVPMVAGWLVWAGGLRAETARDLGSSAIMAALLTRGSERIAGDALAREIDGMAAVLEGFAGRNSVGIHLECLASDLGVVLRRAIECAAMPAFDEDELEEERRVALEELAGEKDDTGGQAFAAAYELLYRGHPFRWRRRGTETSLQRLTAERCRSTWARNYPLSRAVLGLAGDFDVEAVVDLVEHLLPHAMESVAPAWSPAPPRYPMRPQQRETHGAREQAHLVRLYPGLPMGEPRVYALEVLTTILGGQAGRLFQHLREEKGLVYHVSAGASEGIDAGHVSFYAATSHRERDVALAALVGEIERVVAEPVSAAELERAKAWLAGQFEVELQRRSRIASSLAFDEAYGLGAALHLRFPQRVRAVTAADVHAVARELLDPRRAVTVLTRQARLRT